MNTSIETIDQARSTAYQNLINYEFEVHRTPIDTLKNFPWDELQADSEDLKADTDSAIWNRNLDPRSLLGHIAMCGALTESYFVGYEIYAGEVLQDHQADLMRHMIKQSLPIDNQLRREWFNELLMYELPHSVFVVDGDQFDPLSVSGGVDAQKHVFWCEFWEHVLAAIYAAKADTETDTDHKLVLLDKAQEICPEYILLREKRASLLMSRNDPEGIRLLKDIQRIRPTAENLFFLWESEEFSHDSQYKAELDMRYTPAMAEYMLEKYRSNSKEANSAYKALVYNRQ